jgi:hypothetical protein
MEIFVFASKHNNSLQQDGVYGLTKKKSPSLKSNTVKAIISGQGNNSSGVQYVSLS